MATCLDQQIEHLEKIVEPYFDFHDATCDVSTCVLPRHHTQTKPHMSVVEFLEMQVRQGSKIFADQVRRIPSGIHHP